MVIPREEGKVRLYSEFLTALHDVSALHFVLVQLADNTDAYGAEVRNTTAADVTETAKRILKPYSFSWASVDWYSVYPIGQGIAEKYTLDERVFIGGDATHTHSVSVSCIFIFIPI